MKLGGISERQNGLKVYEQALELFIELPAWKLYNIESAGMLRVGMENSHRVSCPDAYDRYSQLIAEHLDRIHHLSLLYSGTGQ